MRRILMLPVLLLSIALAGCGGKVGDLLTVATTTIVNPVDAVDIYRVKNVYAASLEGMKAYRGYCWSKPYKDLMADPIAQPICKSRRPVYRVMLTTKAKASQAIIDATVFVRDHPTLDAASVISAAWTAVTNFRNATPTLK